MSMPAIFVGHGSPMNAIEDNGWSRTWAELGRRYRPKGIVMVSAHWYGPGLKVQDTVSLKKINDMYGFPRALYELEYPAEGSPALSRRIQDLLGDAVKVDNSWGLDHGAWSVMVHMYPDADIPVVQVSVDSDAPPVRHFELGRSLAPLREEGYLIMGSGNVVHNLRRMDPRAEKPFDWTVSFDDAIESWIRGGELRKCAESFPDLDGAALAVPTPDHFLPLLTVLGAADREDRVEVFNKAVDLASITMTGYVFDRT